MVVAPHASNVAAKSAARVPTHARICTVAPPKWTPCSCVDLQQKCPANVRVNVAFLFRDEDQWYVLGTVARANTGVIKTNTRAPELISATILRNSVE